MHQLLNIFSKFAIITFQWITGYRKVHFFKSKLSIALHEALDNFRADKNRYPTDLAVMSVVTFKYFHLDWRRESNRHRYDEESYNAAVY